MITFDHRDENHLGEHVFADATARVLRGVKVEIGTLPLGDIVWEGRGQKRYIIEIKRAGDGLRSLVSGHLQDQVGRLVVAREEEDARVGLIIVGEVGSDLQGYAVGTENGALVWEPSLTVPYARWFNYLTAVQELGVLVHKVALEDFGRAIAAMYRRSLKTSRSSFSIRQPRIMDRRVRALLSLSDALTLPAAERLLEKYGSVREVLRRSPKALAETSGVGPKSANQLYENARDDAILGVRVKRE